MFPIGNNGPCQGPTAECPKFCGVAAKERHLVVVCNCERSIIWGQRPPFLTLKFERGSFNGSAWQSLQSHPGRIVFTPQEEKAWVGAGSRG